MQCRCHVFDNSYCCNNDNSYNNDNCNNGIGNDNDLKENKSDTVIEKRILHGRALMWNFSSSIQLDIFRVNAVKE